jgi:sec-independent protein translocase protein TatA
MVGGQSMLLLLGVVLLLFGGRKLPELAASLGRSMKEFKKATTEGESAAGGDAEVARTPAPTTPAAQARACPTCRAALEAEWAHCPNCGASVPRTPPTA